MPYAYNLWVGSCGSCLWCVSFILAWDSHLSCKFLELCLMTCGLWSMPCKASMSDRICCSMPNGGRWIVLGLCTWLYGMYCIYALSDISNCWDRTQKLWLMTYEVCLYAIVCFYATVCPTEHVTVLYGAWCPMKYDLWSKTFLSWKYTKWAT